MQRHIVETCCKAGNTSFGELEECTGQKEWKRKQKNVKTTRKRSDNVHSCECILTSREGVGGREKKD